MARVESDQRLLNKAMKRTKMNQNQITKYLGYNSRSTICKVLSGQRNLSGPVRRIVERVATEDIETVKDSDLK